MKTETKAGLVASMKMVKAFKTNGVPFIPVPCLNEKDRIELIGIAKSKMDLVVENELWSVEDSKPYTALARKMLNEDST